MDGGRAAGAAAAEIDNICTMTFFVQNSVSFIWRQYMTITLFGPLCIMSTLCTDHDLD